jgi:two-component system response regulator AlgR
MRVMIVDDEPLARQRLQRLLAAHPHCEVIALAEHGQQALQLVQQQAVDLVFLDIEMPGDNGLTVATTLAKLQPPPALVFVTAHPQHALAAFQVAPQGYLLKPVSAASLADCLQRLSVSTRAQLELQKQQQACLSVRVGHELRQIPLNELLLLQAEDKYVRILYRGGEAYSEQSLKWFAGRYTEQLVRVHRNTLVPRARIRGVSRAADGRLLLQLADCHVQPEVSRRGYQLLRQMLQLVEPEF